jgi:hypothetical protein
MMEVIRSYKTSEPHDVTSQKTALFIVTAMKTSNLTSLFSFRNLAMSHFNLITGQPDTFVYTGLDVDDAGK